MISKQMLHSVVHDVDDRLENMTNWIPPEKATHVTFSHETPTGRRLVEVELTQDNFEMILNYIDLVVDIAN